MVKQPQYVFIGGLGGSGTRIVARITQKLGFYLGPVLNEPLDNLLFSFLFKRPDWFVNLPDDAAFARALDSFLTETQHGQPGRIAGLKKPEFRAMMQAIRKWPGPAGARRNHVRAMIDHAAPDLSRYTGIACKEPNTHVFLPQLACHLPDMRFVLVMRNGLDMALSRNRQQLDNWGAALGIEQKPDEPAHKAQLRFWAMANRRCIDAGQTLLGERFHVLRYDDLCTDPAPQSAALAAFLGCRLPKSLHDRIPAELAPSSRGRYRDAAAGTFDDADHDLVRRFGFDVQ